MKPIGRHLAVAVIASIALAGCGSSDGSKDEATATPAEASPKAKCVALKPDVVRGFNDGTTGPGIKAKSGQAVKFSPPLDTSVRVNYAVALQVDTPDGEQVAILATQRINGGGRTIAVDDTARKLFVYASHFGDDTDVGEMRALAETSIAAVTARDCLK